MNTKKKMSLNDVLNDGITPPAIVTKSDRLKNAIEAVSKLDAIELTYLEGCIRRDLETYQAKLVHELRNSMTKGNKGE